MFKKNMEETVQLKNAKIKEKHCSESHILVAEPAELPSASTGIFRLCHNICEKTFT